MLVKVYTVSGIVEIQTPHCSDGNLWLFFPIWSRISTSSNVRLLCALFFALAAAISLQLLRNTRLVEVQSSMLLIMMCILVHAQYGMQFGLARFQINGIRIIKGLLPQLLPPPPPPLITAGGHCSKDGA